MKVRDLIGNPFAGYDYLAAGQQIEDVQGWGGHKEFLRKMIDVSRPHTIFEVGSWKGKSALAMAECCYELHRKEREERHQNPYQLQEIVCIDTWLGATEFVGKADDDPKRGLRRNFGYPTVYFQFMANVWRAQQFNMVTPFPQTSTNAARFFKKNDLKADLIYVDGSHEYDDVWQDLEMYYDLLNVDDPLKKGQALMFGDDYCQYWKGVIKAVNEFAGVKGLYLQTKRYHNGPGEAPSDYWVLSRGGLDL